MRLHIGQPALRGDIARYAQKFDLLELRADSASLPRLARLKEWRAKVPERFVFSVVLPSVVGTLEAGKELDAALAQALRVAEALKAEWLLLQTPASLGPSKRTERKLQELVERLPREQLRVAWEPRGVWEDEPTEILANRLGLHLVRDLRYRPAPPQEVIYSRLWALGAGARLSVGAVELVAERLTGRTEAYVVIEADGAARGASTLRELVAAIAERGDEDEDEDSDEIQEVQGSPLSSGGEDEEDDESDEEDEDDEDESFEFEDEEDDESDDEDDEDESDDDEDDEDDESDDDEDDESDEDDDESDDEEDDEPDDVGEPEAPAKEKALPKAGKLGPVPRRRK